MANQVMRSINPSRLWARSINLLPYADDEVTYILDRLGSRWLAGVIVKDLSDVEAVERVRRWHGMGVKVSVGLGDGDDTQWRRALDVAMLTRPEHLNQPWFASALATSQLATARSRTLVNALISPDDRNGGHIALSPKSRPLRVTWDDLLPNLHEMGIASVKFFPLRGEDGHEAYSALVRRLAQGEGPRIIEPSGGVAPEHLPWLFEEGEAAGLVVIPHVYGGLRRSDGSIDLEALDQIAGCLPAGTPRA